MALLRKLMVYKGRLAFVGAFIALSLAATSVPTSSAPNSASSPTTSRCGVTSCLPKTPATPATPAASTSEASKVTSPSAKASSAASTSASPNTPSQWGTPVVEDDFNGTTLDADNWNVYNSPQGSPVRLPSLVKVSDGALDLEGTYANKQTAGSGASEAYDQKYGRWEIRAKADIGAGFSPTILLWPQDENWPGSGEIDILESPHGNRQNAIAVVHNTTEANFKTSPLSGSQADWHTYAVDWLPDHITFYVDGVAQWTVTNQKLIPKTSAMHLVVQNDAGCNWIQCPNASTKPVTNMEVDWVKVYALQHS